MRKATIATLVTTMLIGLGALAPAPAQASAQVSVSFFYDSLAPHGNWYATAGYGYAWQPTHVSFGWRPYYDGRWVYTDFGWTFVSSDPWGWAAYHYGRWVFDPFYGWLWVPGTEWAPAWVVFYQGAGYVGWAPIPPGVSLSVVFGGGYRLPSSHYVFVEERHFLDSRVGRRALPVERNTRLVRETRGVTRLSRSGDRYVVRGLEVAPIERSARRKVERLRVVDVADGRGGGRSRIGRDRVELFRPRVSAQETHAPKLVRDDRRGGRSAAKVETERRGGRGGKSVEPRSARGGSARGKGKAARDRGRPPLPFSPR